MKIDGSYVLGGILAAIACVAICAGVSMNEPISPADLKAQLSRLDPALRRATVKELVQGDGGGIYVVVREDGLVTPALLDHAEDRARRRLEDDADDKRTSALQAQQKAVLDESLH